MSQFVNEITMLVKAYTERGQLQPVDKLLAARARLAGNLFGLAIEVGDAYREKNATEFRRKKRFNERISDYTRTDREGKMSVAAATVAAENDITNERNAEQEWDGMYRAMWLIYDAGSSVLDAMSQHISTLNKEKSMEMRGQGPQSNQP